MKERIIPEYDIHEGTMVILPHEMPDGTSGSLVYEEEGSVLVNQTPQQILDESCCFYGCTFKGRREGTAHLLKINHKPPVAVNPMSGIYFFPSLSPNNPKCIWLAYSHLTNYSKSGVGATKISFLNGDTHEFEISVQTVEKQLSRTMRLKNILEKRAQMY